MPAAEKSRVEPVAPGMSTPLLVHWYVTVTASPSGSVVAPAVACSVWFVVGAVSVIATVASDGAELATVADAVTAVPDVVGSDGVTLTDTCSPLSPLPAVARFSVSVRAVEFAVVLTTVEPTLHAKVSRTVSPSASAFVAVAVTVWFVVGLAGLRVTVAVGAALPMVSGLL